MSFFISESSFSATLDHFFIPTKFFNPTRSVFPLRGLFHPHLSFFIPQGLFHPHLSFFIPQGLFHPHLSFFIPQGLFHPYLSFLYLHKVFFIHTSSYSSTLVLFYPYEIFFSYTWSFSPTRGLFSGRYNMIFLTHKSWLEEKSFLLKTRYYFCWRGGCILTQFLFLLFKQINTSFMAPSARNWNIMNVLVFLWGPKIELNSYFI